MGETPQSPEPKDVKSNWSEAIGASDDSVRRQKAKQADLEHEIEGMTEDIAAIQEDMSRTGDPALPEALEATTDASMDAQRELQEDDNS